MPPRAAKSKPVSKTYAGTRTTRPVAVEPRPEESDSEEGLEPESEDNQIEDALGKNFAELENGWLKKTVFGDIGLGPAPCKDDDTGPPSDDEAPAVERDDQPSSVNRSFDIQPLSPGVVYPPPPAEPARFLDPNSDTDDNDDPMTNVPAAQSSPLRAPSARLAARATQPTTPKPAAKTRRKQQPSMPAANAHTPASPVKRPAKKAKAKHTVPTATTAPPISLAQAEAAMSNPTTHHNQRRVSFSTNPVFIDTRNQHSYYDTHFPPIPQSPTTPAAASRGSSAAAEFSQSEDEGELITLSKAELRRMLNKSGDSKMSDLTARAHNPGTPHHQACQAETRSIIGGSSHRHPPTPLQAAPALHPAGESNLITPSFGSDPLSPGGRPIISIEMNKRPLMDARLIPHPVQYQYLRFPEPHDLIVRMPAASTTDTRTKRHLNLTQKRQISAHRTSVPWSIQNNLSEGLVRMIWLSDITPKKCDAARKGKDIKPAGKIVVGDDGTIETRIIREDGSADALLTSTEFITASDNLCNAIQRYLKPAKTGLLLASQLRQHFHVIRHRNDFESNFQRYRLRSSTTATSTFQTGRSTSGTMHTRRT
ncbi:hypothetical protein C8J57DRAFT_1262090 [Mycena rebaudengoi]|nr:hypothetical protein C8J57DRAFT_1262090 [Mycena rebaudengoi]